MENNILKNVLTKEEVENKDVEIESRIKNNERLQEILLKFDVSDDIVKKSYAPILRYLDDQKQCNNCLGYDKCTKCNKKGYRIALKYDPFIGYIDDAYIKCDYYKQICKLYDRFIVSDIDVVKCKDTFSKTYEYLFKTKSSVRNSFISVAKSVMKKSVTKYSPKEMNCGAYIYSDNDNGNFLLSLIAFTHAKAQRDIVYLEASRTLTDASSFNKEIKEEADSKIERAKNAPVLVISNLGFEYKSSSARDIILTPLLSSRAKKGLVTYISSRVCLNDLIYSYAKDAVSKKFLESSFNKIVEEYHIEDIELFN